MVSKLMLMSCLFLSYSLCSASSESDDNFIRYDHTHPNGIRHTICINKGAKELSEKYPELTPEFVREEIHSSTKAHEQQHRQEQRIGCCTRLCIWMYTRKES